MFKSKKHLLTVPERKPLFPMILISKTDQKSQHILLKNFTKLQIPSNTLHNHTSINILHHNTLKIQLNTHLFNCSNKIESNRKHHQNYKGGNTLEMEGWHEAAWAAASCREEPEPAINRDTELSTPKRLAASTALNDKALIEPPSCSAKTRVLSYVKKGAIDPYQITTFH